MTFVYRYSDCAGDTTFFVEVSPRAWFQTTTWGPSC